MAHDVFISYCSEDKVVADAVCATLEGHRIRCWIAPRDIRPGEDWGGAVIEGISHARVMVLVFSGHANRSPQILREVERAVHRGLVVIPFRIEAAVPERSLEFFLSSPHWLDALDPPLAKYIDYLAEAIHSVLAQPGHTGSGEAAAAAPEQGATRLLPPPVAGEDPSPTRVVAPPPPAPPPEAPVTGDPARPSGRFPRRPLLGGGVVLAVILIAVIAGRGCSSSSKVATSDTTASTTAPTTSASTPATPTTVTTTVTTTPPTTPVVTPACSAACRALESAVPFDVSQCTPRSDSNLQQYLAVAGIDCVDPSNTGIVVHALSFDTVDTLTNRYNFNVKDWGLVASTTTCDISVGSCEGPWQVAGTTDSPGRVFALYDTKTGSQLVEWSDTRSLRLIWVTIVSPQPDYPKGNNLFFNWCTSATCRSAWV